MKKLFMLILLLIAGVTGAYAQQGNVTFNLITPPCNSNGVLQATATGLTGTITYNFVGMNTSLNVTNTTGTLTNYHGGPLYVFATNSSGGNAYGAYAGAPPFNYNVAITNAVCPAQAGATVTITGGTAPYVIEWMPDNSTTIVGTGSTVSLPDGNYDIRITDAAGCVYGSFAKGDSLHLSVSSGLTIATSSTAAACTNGSAAVTSVTGSTAPYSYQWSNGANTASINGLTTGIYMVSVTSAQGCTGQGSVYVAQTPAIGVNITPTPATCQQNNGSAIAFGSGGTAPYTYAWSNMQTTQTATALTGDASYQVVATDAAGCTGRSSTYIFSSTPITATYSATASACTSATGTATVTATGGTSPYIITWNTFPAQTGATATALAPGNYTFTVTDAAGCVRTGVAVIPPISVVTANLITTNATCAQSNGALAASVTTGSTPYTYLWSNGATAASIANLTAGSYSVQITDNAGCKITKYASIQATTPIVSGINVTQSSCIYTADGTITITPTGGTIPYSYNWSNGQTTASLTAVATGNYTVTVHDAAGCSRTSNVFVPYNPAGTNCYCTITGTVYHDLNSNCTKDAGEPGINNIMVHASGLGYAYTDAGGVYSFKAPTGTYTLSEQVQATYPLAACQNNAQAVSVTAAAGCNTTVNFANAVNPIHDLSIQTISFNGPPVPGNNYYQKLILSNNGTVTEPLIVGYSHDGQLSSPVFVPGGFTSNGSLNYRYASLLGNIAAGTYQQFTVGYTVPTNIPLSTNILFRDTTVNALPMSNWLNDYTPWNNVNAYSATVVGSFDPNNKEVTPVGTGAQGYITRNDSILTYTIHFQNTGTYPAQKVVLVDTLSSNVQVASVKVGASSHHYNATITESGVLKFTFDNINLPDSGTNQSGSIGYVIYTVRQKPNLALGTQIRNKAAIYFDYNAPVITNTTLNTIQANVSIGAVPGVAALGMSVYPNPASNQVGIAIQSASDRGTAGIRFVNLVGQTVLQQEVAIQRGSNLFEASTGSLVPGLYFVEVSDGQHSVTAKLSIVR